MSQMFRLGAAGRIDARRAALAGGVLLLLPALASCARPPASAYIAGGTGGQGGGLTPIARDAQGEACGQIEAGEGAGQDIFCGGWHQPSARVRPGPVGSPGELAAIAADSPWRHNLIDTRFVCGAPRPRALAGGDPAVAMDCTRKVGGWPQVALVALAGGHVWYADGTPSSLPVIERSIAVDTGRAQPEAGVKLDTGSDTDTQRLVATAMAAAAAPLTQATPAAAGGPGTAPASATAPTKPTELSAKDRELYDALLRRADTANQVEDFPTAETAYRAALSLQERALGRGNPNTATLLASIALQVANQGRTAEAAPLFARAASLAASPENADKTAPGRVAQYRGIAAFDAGDPTAALTLYDQAEAAYTRLVPPKLLAARAQARQNRGAGTARVLADRLADQALETDPVQKTALIGVIDVRRNRALALESLGRHQEADAQIQSAQLLAAGNGLNQDLLAGRLYRTAAIGDQSRGAVGAALSNLSRSDDAIIRSLPGTLPLAQNDLLRAAAKVADGRPADAIDDCRRAAALLREIKRGVTAELLAPCLAGFHAAAEGAGPAARQGLLAEMFDTAQLQQGGVTTQQITKASRVLAASAKDPRAGAAIRAADDAQRKVAELQQQHDAMEQAAKSGAGGKPGDLAAIDAQLAKATAEAAEAEAALQTAAPNYGQLVQQVVDARTVFSLLHPGEAFVATALSASDGWTFMLRDGTIAVGEIKGGLPAITTLVARVRKSVEPRDDGTPPPFDVAASRALEQAVLGGVGERLSGTKALVVSPDGPLLSVPFSLLLTGPADPEQLGSAPFLVRQMTIAHVPAAANFVSLRRVAGTSHASQPWFGFGSFVPVTLAQAQHSFPSSACADSARELAGLPPLPGAQKELATVRALLGAAPDAELLGPAYTVPAVLATDLQRYRVLHFATHAILPTDLACQDEPAIIASAPAGAVNASGALLTSSEVVNLHLDADAVLLSACNTGGPNGGTAGESLSGLARSFFYAGARSLLITHWEVNDRYTAYLVALLFAEMKGHPEAGLAADLAAAQRRVLDDAKGDLAGQAHPFYWAALALIGDGSGTPGRMAGL